MESREEERKGSGAAAAAAVSTPGANLMDIVSREYYGHKKSLVGARQSQEDLGLGLKWVVTRRSQVV
ncbi:hypothetical protein BS78_04G038900 [Paspalum vaginatum]|nr:hypothetical protein BS78_04G038900 [Paspalum vaginatum]